MRYHLIAAYQAHRRQCPLSVLFKVLDVNASSFYKYRKHHPEIDTLCEAERTEIYRRRDRGHLGTKHKALVGQAVDESLCLAVAIERIFKARHHTYGYRRVWATLSAEGFELHSVKPVRTIMEALGLKAFQARAFKPQTTCGDPLANRAPNLLLALDEQGVERRLRACEQGVVLLSDVTYIAMRDSAWAYLCCWTDQFTRRILSWAVGWEQTDALIAETLGVALNKLAARGAGVIAHSDGGSPYTSHLTAAMAEHHGALQSMTRRGNTYDNAQAESLWARMKTELQLTGKGKKRKGHIFESVEELEHRISAYISDYNVVRVHSSLGYQSPIGYELKLPDRLSVAERQDRVLLEFVPLKKPKQQKPNS